MTNVHFRMNVALHIQHGHSNVKMMLGVTDCLPQAAKCKVPVSVVEHWLDCKKLLLTLNHNCCSSEDLVWCKSSPPILLHHPSQRVIQTLPATNWQDNKSPKSNPLTLSASIREARSVNLQRIWQKLAQLGYQHVRITFEIQGNKRNLRMNVQWIETLSVDHTTLQGCIHIPILNLLEHPDPSRATWPMVTRTVHFSFKFVTWRRSVAWTNPWCTIVSHGIASNLTAK